MRLDFQLKALGHWSHLYSRSSVWTIMCWPRLDKESTSSSVNSIHHTSHICNPQDKWTVCDECVYLHEYWGLVEIIITCLCTCTHLGRSSHSLYTRGRARRCLHVPVWSPLSVCQRWSQYWSTNTSGAAAAQVLRKTAHHSLHSGTSARLHIHTQTQTDLFSHHIVQLPEIYCSIAIEIHPPTRIFI